MKSEIVEAQMKDLLLQSLEHELGGVNVYQTAVNCVVNPQLSEEWQGYLAQTRKHVEVLTEACRTLGLDPDEETPGRQVVRFLGNSLVEAMNMALAAGNPTAAELVACECVVLAETKDHLDWTLIGKCAEHLGTDKAVILKQAYDQVEDEEDEHLYHSKGWCRELWIKSLGMNAVLPPPEEERQVKTAMAAARAEQAAELAR